MQEALARYFGSTKHLYTGQSIAFSTYMQAVLYHPEFGYYSTRPVVFGARGDFMTAPLYSPLWGKALARVLDPLLERLPASACFFEYGPGDGTLAAALAREGVPYYMLEVGKQRVQEQRARASRAGVEYRWRAQLPKGSIGIGIANECLDAFPCHRFQWDRVWRYSRVFWNAQRGFFEAWCAVPPRLYADFCTMFQRQWGYDAQAPDVPLGLTVEYSPQQERVLQQLAKRLQQGYVWIFDYGRDRSNLPLHAGTVRAYAAHHLHGPLDGGPHSCDITADVPFSAIARTAVDLGFHVEGYTTQAGFLLGSGILSECSPETGLDPHAAHGLQMLLQPYEMGERIRVLVLSRGMEGAEPIAALGFQDWSGRL